MNTITSMKDDQQINPDKERSQFSENSHLQLKDSIATKDKEYKELLKKNTDLQEQLRQFEQTKEQLAIYADLLTVSFKNQCDQHKILTKNSDEILPKKRGRKPLPKPLVELEDYEKRTTNQVRAPVFICDFRRCENKYTTKFALQRHFQTSHYQKLLFKCLHPGCPQKFNLPQYLKEHEIVHNLERPFECAKCKKTFRQRGRLSLHMTKVHKYEMEPLLEHISENKSRSSSSESQSSILFVDRDQSQSSQHIPLLGRMWENENPEEIIQVTPSNNENQIIANQMMRDSSKSPQNQGQHIDSPKILSMMRTNSKTNGPQIKLSKFDSD